MNVKDIKMFNKHCFTIDKEGRFILFVFLLALFSVSSYGQKIISAKDIESSTTVLKNGGFDVDRLNSLLNDIQPAAYFQNGETNYYGSGDSEVLYVDFAQLSNIPSQINKLARVEMVKIYLKGNNPQMVNPEFLNELPNLKYIFFVCESCGGSNMTNALSSRQSFSEDILVIHNAEINN